MADCRRAPVDARAARRQLDVGSVRGAARTGATRASARRAMRGGGVSAAPSTMAPYRRTYTPGNRYTSGDSLEHPIFGRGVVEKIDGYAAIVKFRGRSRRLGAS